MNKYKIFIILGVFALSVGGGVYAYMNRAVVVHSEVQATRDITKSVSCSMPGYCYNTGYVNGEFKTYYGFHPNCTGSKKVEGVEDQVKEVYSNDEIKIRFHFKKQRDLSSCSQ